MSSESFALALIAGMLATVNPCGFALLPAYLSAFVGIGDGGSRVAAVGRALAVSAMMTAGFISVFGGLGLVFSPILDVIKEHGPWFTIVFGILLVALGVYMLTGRELNLRIPKLQRGGADGTLASMYLFGVSYAVASLGCSIGGFLVATSAASSGDGFINRLASFVVYGIGMGLVVAVLTVAVALARHGLVARFRAFLPRVSRVAGALVVIAGLYVAYYGWYEIRVLQRNGNPEDPVIDAASRVQTWLQSLMPNTGNYGWYLAGGVAAIAASIAWSRRNADESDEPDGRVASELQPDALDHAGGR